MADYFAIRGTTSHWASHADVHPVNTTGALPGRLLEGGGGRRPRKLTLEGGGGRRPRKQALEGGGGRRPRKQAQPPAHGGAAGQIPADRQALL